MAHETNSIDEFLSHKSQERSGGYLSGWKKNKKVTVWLHTKRMPIALWQHKFPRIHVKENKQTGEAEKHVWGGAYNCHEDEGVLKKQYRYLRDQPNVREVPPRRCPMCKLIEFVQASIDAGKLSWTKPLFRFEADDPKETTVIHVGGICNLFGSDDLTQDQKLELKKANIYPTEAWKENAYAKMSYVFCVVDNDAPSSGVQIAVETGLLGDKVKDVINDARESLGVEEGNPVLHPFAVQWEFRPDEPEFGKKYKARRMEKLKLTPEIAALIRGDAPDLSNTIAPYDIKTMRAFLERHCLVKTIPWNEIFSVEAPPAPQSSAKEIARAPESTPDVEMVECNKCDKPLRLDATTCPHCGQQYDDDGLVEVEPPPPPPPMRKRGAKAAATPPPPPTNDDSDEIPF